MSTVERGAASINIELLNSMITVNHGESGEVLAEWVAQNGDWEKLWRCINEMIPGGGRYE